MRLCAHSRRINYECNDLLVIVVVLQNIVALCFPKMGPILIVPIKILRSHDYCTNASFPRNPDVSLSKYFRSASRVVTLIIIYIFNYIYSKAILHSARKRAHYSYSPVNIGHRNNRHYYVNYFYGILSRGR